jgi:hypothetical protein
MSGTTLDFANGIYSFVAMPRQALCVIPREVAESIYHLYTASPHVRANAAGFCDSASLRAE